MYRRNRRFFTGPLAIALLIMTTASCTSDDSATEEPLESEEIADSDAIEEEINDIQGNIDEQVESEPPPEQEVPVTSPTSPGVVRYVTANSLNIRESASTEAKVVGMLHRGDTVVVELEGDWAKLSNGHYVSAKLLSSEPIGRERKQKEWQAPTENQ